MRFATTCSEQAAEEIDLRRTIPVAGIVARTAAPQRRGDLRPLSRPYFRSATLMSNCTRIVSAIGFMRESYDSP